MNYRHIYHAGSFADVHKHFILVQIIEYLLKKPTPFTVLDTHAGIGLYDLNSVEAKKTLEYQTGIGKILGDKDAPGEFTKYFSMVEGLNNDELQLYPGSPLIAYNMLREIDSLIACELHPEDYQELKSLFKKDKNVHVHHQDAYNAIKAFLPFQSKRGVVIMDPPFEKDDEFEKLISALNIASRRANNNIFLIWYPIKNYLTISKFHQELQSLDFAKIFVSELILSTKFNDSTLFGCGMIIINIPWQLDKVLLDCSDYLLKNFKIDNSAKVNNFWLKNNDNL